MFSNVDVWKNAQEAVQAYTPFYQQEAVQKIRDAEAGQYWFALLTAKGLEPAPLTFNDLRAVNPYAAPTRIKELLKKGIKDAFFTETDEGKFRVAEKGNKVLDAFFNTAQKKLLEAPSLSPAEMNRLAQLLGKIVSATEAAPKPAKKFSLAGSRWTDPQNGAPAALMVDQYITDLARYRDDAHIAAWQSSDLNGHEWEALTFVWNDDAHSAEELAEKRENRGYSIQDYAEALHVLAQRGLLLDDGGQYQLTPEGQSLRDQAEEETDRLFYVGWAVLNKDDLKTMNQLLIDLKHVLQEAVEPEPVAA